MTLGTGLAVALPAVPFLAALAGLLLPLRARRTAAALGVGASGIALLAAVLLAAGLGEPFDSAVTVVEFGDIAVTAGVRVDPVAAAVAVAVGAVACAVQVYSVSYLRDDDRYVPYAAQVSLFTAAMLTVVVASDLVQLLVGWEVMGICSYLLIGHDRRLPEAPGAAVKAFLVTRVGDVGFWLGVVLLGLGAGSFRVADVLDAAAGGRIDGVTLTAAALLLLTGVAGKSAQFPLHTWLPDAMAGPTPISALIHAATMVAAGVYVVGRLFGVYAAAPVALATFGVMAAVTMLLGALAATAQDDIKRVLAWSTVSQIGYMAAALAVGSTVASTFHLLSHAAFKALLFLAAGAVIHAAGSTLMSPMGGVRRSAPVTFWTMTIGLAALAGVPPFSGFWSKESVLGAAYQATVTPRPAALPSGAWSSDGAAHHAAGIAGLPAGGEAGIPAWTAWLVLGSGLATVLVTGWYATRLWLRTFFGEPRGDVHPHDPPPLMRWPLVLLAVPSAVLGIAVAALPARWSEGLPPFDPPLTLLVLVLTALGGGAAWLAWRRQPAADPARTLGAARPVFARAFYLDDVQHALVVRPARALARAACRGDERLVDGAVEGAGDGALGLGRWLAGAHRAGLPGYATAVLAGAVLLAAAATVTGALT